MKLSEMKPCPLCKGPLGAVWMTVRNSPTVVQIAAARQVAGLAMVFNSQIRLAEVFAPEDSPIIVGMDHPDYRDTASTVHICMNCWAMKCGDLPSAMEKP